MSAVVTASALLLVGCGGGTPGESSAGTSRTPTGTGSPSAEASTPSASATESPSTGTDDRGTVVTTGASDFGTMLFDRREQAIYLFDRETSDRPDCYGECAEAWPPVLTTRGSAG